MTKSTKPPTLPNAPPPRPAKSTLRTKATEKLILAAVNIRKQGRFTEHFDQLPPQELLDFIGDIHETTGKKASVSPQISPHSSSSISTTTTTPTTTTKTNSSPAGELGSYFPPMQRPLSRKLSTASRRSLSTSLSTPPSKTLSSATTVNYTRSSRKRYLSTASLSSPTTSLYRRPSSSLTGKLTTTFFSLNRAAVIISRLEQWLQLVKCVIQWLEETAKLHLQMSRGYSQRHLPLFQMELQPDQTPAASTLYAGLRLLTTNVADAHHAFGGNLQRIHIPALYKFKREVKEKISVLKNDPRLLLDELLRRAEQTKKCMDQLNKSCRSADADKNRHHHHHGKNASADPWLANLYVLRQLKREVDEENRLRTMMVPIQKETADFEARLLVTLKPAIQYCCEYLAPDVWDGSADEETAPFQLLMDRIVPDTEWRHFYQREEKELVDEQQVIKDYLNINYTNKLHEKVVTLKKATMQRYIGGVRAKFSDRLYVLSQGGYLHQFRMDDKVIPERSIYIPDSTISAVDDCIFEIRLPVNSATLVRDKHENNDAPEDSLSPDGSIAATQQQQKQQQRQQQPNSHHHNHQRQRKVYVIKASNKEELLSWCQILTEMAARRLPIRQPRRFNRQTSPTALQKSDDSRERQLDNTTSTSIDSLMSTSSISTSAESDNERDEDAVDEDLVEPKYHRHQGPSPSVDSVDAPSPCSSSRDISAKTPSFLTTIPAPNTHTDSQTSVSTVVKSTTDTLIMPKSTNSIDTASNNSDRELKTAYIESFTMDSLDNGNRPNEVESNQCNGENINLTNSEMEDLKTDGQTDENSSEEGTKKSSSLIQGRQIYGSKYDDHLSKGNSNNREDEEVDSDDSSSTISNGSVSTVTRRYSLLPTSSNNQHLVNDHDEGNTEDDDNDDDNVSMIASSIYTEYDDAASHISSSRLSISTASTYYDDASSSIYFSSSMSSRSVVSTGSSDSSVRRSSFDVDSYHRPMTIPDLDD